MLSNEKICSNCNAEVKEGSNFCSKCGIKLEFQDIFLCPTCGAKINPDSNFCSKCGTRLVEDFHEISSENNNETIPNENLSKSKPEVNYNDNMPENVYNDSITANKSGKTKVKFSRGKITTVITALIIVIIAVFAGILTLNRKTGSPFIMYIKDQELNFSYLSKAKPFELTNKLVDSNDVYSTDEFYDLNYFIHVSEDHKYIFYPDEIGDYEFSIYWRELKADKSKESHKIDSGLIIYMTISKNGDKMFYLKGTERKLYVYDRKKDEKSKLDENVMNLYVSDDGDYIIYTALSDGMFNIYEMHLNGIKGEKSKIDSNKATFSLYPEYIAAYPNSKKVFYLKDDNLYVKENNKDKVKIASKVSNVISVVNEKSVYYIKEEEVKVSLDKFVADDLLDTDKAIVEPATPSYPDEPIYPDMSDYTYQKWYSSYWGYEYNSDLDEWGYWIEETDWDRYNEAIDQYKKDYAKWENEYNRLTEEYTDNYNLYEEKLLRDKIRNELKDSVNAITYKKHKLYYWNGETETLIADNLSLEYPFYQSDITTSLKVPVVIYKKYSDLDSKTYMMSDLFIDDYYDIVDNLRNRIQLTRSITDKIYIAYEDKEYPVETKAAIKWTISDDYNIYYMDEYNRDKMVYTLNKIKLSDTGIDSPVKVDENVTDYCLLNGDRLIYYREIKEGSGDIYQDGKQLATDVYFDSIVSIKDSDALFYMIDYSTSNDEGTLCCLIKDKQVTVSDNVYSFIPVSEKNIVYLKDYDTDREKGDLVLYQGNKKKVTIDTEVSVIFNFNNHTVLPYDYNYFLNVISD